MYVKEVKYVRVCSTNFTSAKKMKADLETTLDSRLETSEASNNPPDVRSRSKIVPSPSKKEMDSFYAELNGCKIKPIALSLVAPFAESFVQKSRYIPTENNLSDPKYQIFNIQNCWRFVLNK